MRFAVPDPHMTWGVPETVASDMPSEKEYLTGPGATALLNHKPHSGRGTPSLSFCNASRKEKITPESHRLIE